MCINMNAIENFEREERYYELLGCNKSSSREQIATEFRLKAKIFHPDKNTGTEREHEHYRRLQEAYDVLGDNEQRKHYDKWLDSKLRIPFTTWLTMSRQGHISMHWGGIKKVQALKSTDELEKKDYNRSFNQPVGVGAGVDSGTDEQSSQNNRNHNIPTSERRKRFGDSSFFSNEKKSKFVSSRSKFRNYQI